MSRQYYRRRKKDDLITPIGIILGLFALSAYYKLSIIQRKMLGYGIVLLAVVIIILVLSLKQMQRERERKRLQALEVIDLENMNGIAFEKYIAEIIKTQGYSNIKLTEYYDWGVDVIAEKDGIRWGIQVKRYSGLVKAAAVRQVVTGLNKYNCSRAMVVTNSFYSRPARELARSNNCILIDQDILAEWILDYRDRRQNALTAPATNKAP